MIALLNAQKPGIEAICKTFRIRRLEIFGSAAKGDFNPAHSDLDFIVEFDASDVDTGLLNRFLALATALEKLLGREVDLLTPQSIRNPYFKKKVDESRELVYEA